MANIDFSKRKREDKDVETKLADVVNALRDRLDEQEVRARAQEDRFRKQDGELQNLKRALRQREISQQRLGKRVADLEEQMEEKEEELKELKRKVTPLPLWKILTDVQYRDIFETCIVPKLSELEFRVFREVNRESRDTIRRSGRELQGMITLKYWDEGVRAYEKVTRKNENCHLDILKYLHENAAPWDWKTCHFAADNNHIECLNYAKENGCPQDVPSPSSPSSSS